jgi:hypothetical protein
MAHQLALHDFLVRQRRTLRGHLYRFFCVLANQFGRSSPACNERAKPGLRRVQRTGFIEKSDRIELFRKIKKEQFNFGLRISNLEEGFQLLTCESGLERPNGGELAFWRSDRQEMGTARFAGRGSLRH